MKKLLCFLGFHDYESVRAVTSTMSSGVVFLYIDGDVCKRCKKMDPEHVSSAKHAYLLMLTARDCDKVSVHPAVFGGNRK